MIVAWDTETALIRPGVKAPELACLTYEVARVGKERHGAKLVHHTNAVAFMRDWLADPDAILVGHNVAFDVGVMCAYEPSLTPLFFEAYEANRITDTMWRQTMIDIALGCYRWATKPDGARERVGYSLFDVTRRHTGRILEKDEFRYSYGRWRHLPLADWADGARTYPLEDARATLDVYLAQEALREQAHDAIGADIFADQWNVARGFLALHLTSCRGLRTDPAGVAELEREVREELAGIASRLVEAKLVRADGSRDTKAASRYMVSVCQAQGEAIPRTPAWRGGLNPKGEPRAPEECVCLDADACSLVDDDLLADYSRFVTLNTLLSKDVKALRSGSVTPIHTNFGMAESTRTTSAGPNVQNWWRGES